MRCGRSAWLVFQSVYTNGENEALEWALGVLIHLMRREVHTLCKVCGCAVETTVMVLGMDLVLGDSLWITLASYTLGRQNIFCYTTGWFSLRCCPLWLVLPNLKSKGEYGFSFFFFCNTVHLHFERWCPF